MNKRVVEAQFAVVAARAALIDTARELQQRLQPKTIAREAWESAKVKGADMAEEAVDAVKRRPVATGGIVAAIAMFLAREPIKDGVRNLYDAMTSEKDGARPLTAKPISRKPSAKQRVAPRKARKMETQ